MEKIRSSRRPGGTTAWTPTTWRRRDVNERGEAIEIPGAKITDRERGLTYWATAIDSRGGPQLTWLAVQPTDTSGYITPQVLSQVPTAKIARTTLDTVQPADEGIDVVFRSRIWPSGRKPNLRELAAEVPNHSRAALARRLGTSPATLDRWIAEARRDGHLPPATRGRPRKFTQKKAS